MVKLGLNFLVVCNVVAQGLLVFLIWTGATVAPIPPTIARAAPWTGAGVVVLLMLLFFYARWMFPGLRTRTLVGVIFFKELAVFLLGGLAIGLVALGSWLLG